MISRIYNEGALTEFNDSIRIFRTERLTPKGCGNKAFKLDKNLDELQRSGCNSVLSFGGQWSNHLHAFALACEARGIKSVAAVRGEVSTNSLATNSLLLNDAIAHGLQVRCLSYSDYRKRADAVFARELASQLNCDAYLPEGGSNTLAVDGCRVIAQRINQWSEKPPACIALAVGTGATMAGIVNGAETQQSVVGVPVVEDDRLPKNIEAWVVAKSEVAPWQLLPAARPARYGKVDSSLLEFVLDTYSRTGIILDPVYNAKALRAVLESDLAAKTDCSSDRVAGDLVFVHTGGVGGCLGFADQLLAIEPMVAGAMLAEVREILQIGKLE